MGIIFEKSCGIVFCRSGINHKKKTKNLELLDFFDITLKQNVE